VFILKQILFVINSLTIDCIIKCFYCFATKYLCAFDFIIVTSMFVRRVYIAVVIVIIILFVVNIS